MHKCITNSLGKLGNVDILLKCFTTPGPPGTAGTRQGGCTKQMFTFLNSFFKNQQEQTKKSTILTQFEITS